MKNRAAMACLGLVLGVAVAHWSGAAGVDAQRVQKSNSRNFARFVRTLSRPAGFYCAKAIPSGQPPGGRAPDADPFGTGSPQFCTLDEINLAQRPVEMSYTAQFHQGVWMSLGNCDLAGGAPFCVIWINGKLQLLANGTLALSNAKSLFGGIRSVQYQAVYRSK